MPSTVGGTLFGSKATPLAADQKDRFQQQASSFGKALSGTLGSDAVSRLNVKAAQMRQTAKWQSQQMVQNALLGSSQQGAFGMASQPEKSSPFASPMYGGFGGRMAQGAGLGGYNKPVSQMAAKWSYDDSLSNFVPPIASQPGGGFGSTGGLNPAAGNNQYDQYFVQAAAEMSAKYGVPMDPGLLKAMAHIESGGSFSNGPEQDRDDGFGDGLSIGIMQVKPSIWQSLVPDANPRDPLGNIRLGAAIMAKAWAECGSWQCALTGTYFPVDDPNGTTQDMYLDRAQQYWAQYSDGSGGLTSGGGVTGGFTSQQFWAAFGGVQAPVTFEFTAEGGRDLYGYGTAHGLNGTGHTGVDVGVPRGTQLYAPVSGTVSCVGWQDAGIGGTGGGGCGYYSDEQGGIGNITIKTDDGKYIILGHSATASVRPGQRVQAGSPVGTSGGLYGDHTHYEMRVPDSGTQSGYRIVDPRNYLGGTVTGGGGGGASTGSSGYMGLGTTTGYQVQRYGRRF